MPRGISSRAPVGTATRPSVEARSWPGAQAARDRSGRLVLSHGPITLILGLDGAKAEVARAEQTAQDAFADVLGDLVAELPLLRRPLDPQGSILSGTVARRMVAVVLPLSGWFITPMAAVAGAVADHVLDAIAECARLDRIAVNNGGDIALRLEGDALYRFGISDCRRGGGFAGIVTLRAADGIGGVATSGWHGRSHSLGIADAVTVLARTAAQADAAATLIANAVDLPGSSKIKRQRAHDLSPDSDLGDRLVTVDVAALDADEKAEALGAGVHRAEKIIAMGAARAAFLSLQGTIRTVGAGAMLDRAVGHIREES